MTRETAQAPPDTTVSLGMPYKEIQDAYQWLRNSCTRSSISLYTGTNGRHGYQSLHSLPPHSFHVSGIERCCALADGQQWPHHVSRQLILALAGRRAAIRTLTAPVALTKAGYSLWPPSLCLSKSKQWHDEAAARYHCQAKRGHRGDKGEGKEEGGEWVGGGGVP
jgi:hypothetical protein